MVNKLRSYQQCSRCVMDTSEISIVFDQNGVCNLCKEFDSVTKKNWFPNSEGEKLLQNMIESIKSSGVGKDYDCILGLSGGIDSSYMAIKVKEWGLRPLVVHVDAGWNSEIAVGNIEKIIKHCNYDLHTHVIDWEDMRDLQLAYLKSAVANQDVPQDHAFFAALYHYATRNNIKYILSGGNIATEGISPKTWHGSAMDAINLKAIHRKFGTRKLKSYPTISFFEYYIYYPLIRGMRTFRPLNYMPYDKDMAIDFLQKEIGWRPYGRKHGESVFTKLFQNYYLPTKFGFDKRKPHLSSLIVSGQMTREEALAELSSPLYDMNELETDIMYFCKKLRITRDEFEVYMKAPIHDYTDFANWNNLHSRMKLLQKFGEKIIGRKVRVYS